MEFNLFSIGIGLVALALVYNFAHAVHNLYFHPLAKFPGPWWAGVSYLAEFYYDVIEGGRYFMVVAHMHEKYGECGSTDLQTKVINMHRADRASQSE